MLATRANTYLREQQPRNLSDTKAATHSLSLCLSCVHFNLRAQAGTTRCHRWQPRMYIRARKRVSSQDDLSLSFFSLRKKREKNARRAFLTGASQVCVCVCCDDDDSRKVFGGCATRRGRGDGKARCIS